MGPYLISQWLVANMELLIVPGHFFRTPQRLFAVEFSYLWLEGRSMVRVNEMVGVLWTTRMSMGVERVYDIGVLKW